MRHFAFGLLALAPIACSTATTNASSHAADDPREPEPPPLVATASAPTSSPEPDPIPEQVEAEAPPESAPTPEPAPAPALEPAPTVEQRSVAEALEAGDIVRLRVPWGTTLYRSPSRNSKAFTLGNPTGSMPEPIMFVTAVRGKESDWLELRPVGRCMGSHYDDRSCNRQIDGLEFYDITLYVPADVGQWSSSKPGRSMAILGVVDPFPVQQQQTNAGPVGDHVWLVTQGKKVYWSNGKLAGIVDCPHVFSSKGKSREVENRKLTCFDIMMGPDAPSSTRLCFDAKDVDKIEAQGGNSSFLDSPYGGAFVDSLSEDDVWGGLGKDEEKGE